MHYFLYRQSKLWLIQMFAFGLGEKLSDEPKAKM